MASIIKINRSKAMRRVSARCIDWTLYVVTGITLLLSSQDWIALLTGTEWSTHQVEPDPLPPPVTWIETYAIPDLPPWSSIFAIHLASVILLLIPSLLYELPLIAARGQTVGKILMGIKVTKNSAGCVLGWTRSTIRWAVFYLPLLIPIVGILIFLLTAASPLFDSKRRGWHDKIAGTLVAPVSKDKESRTPLLFPTGAHKRLLARTIDWLLYSIAGVTFLIWSIGLLELEGSTFIDLYNSRVAIEPLSISYQIEGIRRMIYESDFWLAVFGIHNSFTIVFVSVVIYELPLTALRGETIGKILTKTQVICIDSGRVPGWKKASIRWMVLYLPLLAIPIIGILIFLLTAASPLFNPQRRGWHDKAAGTIVVPASEGLRVSRPSRGVAYKTRRRNARGGKR